MGDIKKKEHDETIKARQRKDRQSNKQEKSKQHQDQLEIIKNINTKEFI